MSLPHLFGRERELTRAISALHGARDGGRGSVVLVTGVAGIGKSALLTAIRRRAQVDGFAVGYAKADEGDRVAAGALALLALRSGTEPLLDASAFRALEPLYDRRLWLADGIADALENRARDRPIVVALDDVQHADQLTRFLVRTLSGRLAGSPVVWVLTRRGTWTEAAQDYDSHDPLADVVVEHLALGPLADDAVRALAADVVGGPISDGGAEHLRGAGGSPLLVRQMAVDLATRTGPDGAGARSSSSLAATVRARTRNLPDTTLALLHLLAVWGRRIALADVAELLSLGSSQKVVAHVERAVDLGLVEMGPAGPGGDTVDFVHDLIREFFYGDLSRTALVRLHQRCASHLSARVGADPVEIVPHAVACARLGDPRVVSLLRASAARIIDTLPHVAAELAEAAFRMVEVDDPAWSDVGEETAATLLRANRGTAAVALVDTLLSRTREPARRARLQIVATRALWPMGRPMEITQRVDSALSAPGVPVEVSARLMAAKALALTRVESATAASEAAATALRMAGDDDPAVGPVALAALGQAARNEARYDRARAWFHQARQRFGTLQVSAEIVALQNLDRYAEAQSLIDEAQRGTAARSDSVLPDLLAAQQWQEWYLGRLDAAAATATSVVRVSDELGVSGYKVEAWVLMSIHAVLQREFAAASDLLDRAARDVDIDDAARQPEIALVRGYVEAAQGRPAAAVAILRPLMADATHRHHYWPRSQEWSRLQAGAAVAAGDTEFAAICVANAELLAERNPGVPTIEGVALMTRGFVHGDVGLLERAAAVLDGAPRPMVLARALSDLGQALVRRGECARGVTHLERALDLYQQLGVRLYPEEVRAALRSAGATPAPAPRVRPSFGWASLTATELTVAELVSAGLTNRETARRLQISVHTVNTHVRSVFAKLDLHSRVQLANVWRSRQSS